MEFAHSRRTLFGAVWASRLGTIAMALGILSSITPSAIAAPMEGDLYRIDFHEIVGTNPAGITQLDWTGSFTLGAELAATPGVFSIATFSALIGHAYPNYPIDLTEAPGFVTYTRPIWTDRVCCDPWGYQYTLAFDSVFFDTRINRFNTSAGLLSYENLGSGYPVKVAMDIYGYGGFSNFLEFASAPSNVWRTYNGYDLNLLGVYSGLTERERRGTFEITTAVPEPGTYAMFLAGLGLLGFTARRRKQSA